MSTVVKDLGAVSAYAYAVEKGYTGTEAEFAELMADYANVGQRTEDAAGSAMESKTAAQTAATTATTKASEAATSAQTATTKAGEATTAAGTATTAKNDAVSAKTAAETAQGKAEDAQAAAESVAESIPSDYSQLSEDVSDLKEDFTDMVNSSYVTDSASGSVAHFTDGADGIPMKSVKVNIDPLQSGSGDPSPSNVRAISGWDSVKVTRSGKNVLKPPTVSTTTHNGITFTYMPDGGIKCNGTSTGVAYSSKQNDFKLQVGQYTKNPQDTNGVGVIVQTMTTPDWTSVQGGGVADRTVVIKEEDTKYTLAVRIRVPSGITLTDYVIYPMLRLVSDTDDTYEPYNGNTYNISLSSAGTVYGGTLDAVSGVLTVDKAIVDLGTLNWTYESTLPRFYTNGLANDIRLLASNDDVVDGVSSMYKVVSFNNLYVTGKQNGTMAVSTTKAVSVINTDYTDATSFKTAMSGQMFVYPLATPLTYQLSATEVKSLLGINNIWSDAGDVDVEYRADTKLYIKRLTGSDTDMIADTNITSGQYFMVGNDLYRATVNIASGAQIVVGTNAAKVSLSEALNEINA